MASRIIKEMSFLAGLHFEEKFMINLYEFQMNITVHTDDSREQGIAMERIMYLVDGHLSNSVIISETETAQIEKYTEAGHKLCVVPEEPYDQIFGLILLNKFNAIMDGKLEVTDMIFGSKLSDYIKFDISKEEAVAMFPDNSWYNHNNLLLRDVPKKKKEKVVKFCNIDEWAELGLNWKEKAS